MRIQRLIPTVLAGVLVLLAFSASSAFAREIHAYSGASFGKEGSGNGEFKEPSGVAVSEVGATKGDVYVVDKGNNRVERFSAAGVFLGQFDGSGSFEVEGKTESGTPAPSGAFSAPHWIAVDNDPASPSKGDVYVTDTGNKVVDKFGPDGEYVGQITEAGGADFKEALFGVAVDPAGVLWVYYEQGERGYIASYSDAETNIEISAFPEGAVEGYASPGLGFAVNSEDDLYLGTFFEEIGEVNSAGELIHELIEEGRSASAVAVDPGTGDAYVDNLTSVAVVDSNRAVIERFGDEGGVENLSAGSGLAVNSSSPAKTVYVADSAADAVKVFTDVVVPDVTTEAASSVKTASGESSATLNGTVTPDGVLPVTSCEFEYVSDGAYRAAVEAKAANPYEGGAIVPCAQSPGAGTSPVAVSAEVPGLAPTTLYDFRLVAANTNGTNQGSDIAFATPAAPVVESETEVSSAEPKLEAKIDPDYQATSYYLEYATSEETIVEGKGQVVKGAALLPAVFENVLAGPFVLKDLAPGYYHYRFVAENQTSKEAGEPAYGQIKEFQTYAVPAVTTNTAQESTRTSVPVSGVIDPQGIATTYHFAYVPQAEYEPGAANPYAHGKNTYETKLAEENGTSIIDYTTHPVALTLEELQPGTTYDYALVASNELGTIIGANHSFTTSPPTAPVATTGGAVGVSQLSGTITGSVDTSALQTAMQFEFGPTPYAGELLPATVVSSEGSLRGLAVVFSGELQPATTYYYRVVASNQDGVAYGAEQSFTTPGFPAGFAPAAVIPFAPYTSIGTLDANEAKEGKATAPAPKSLTRGEKLAKALRGCGAKGKARRKACERKAREEFGPEGRKRAKK